VYNEQEKDSRNTIVAPIPAEDLVDSILSSMTFEQIHAFIVKLDKGCEDWGVTEKLFKYFQKEMKKMPKEEKLLEEVHFHE
jgi:hypothetical protein